MRKKEVESSLAFLKGGNNEFNAAMESINDMFSDVFKTVDFEEGAISDPQNLEKFEPIEEMWNEMIHGEGNQGEDEEEDEDGESEVVFGEPIIYDTMREVHPKSQNYMTHNGGAGVNQFGGLNPYETQHDF